MREFNVEYIKSRRLMLGLTYREMADAMSMKNASTYQKYEKGDYAFKAIHLPPFAEALQCTINSFFTPEIKPRPRNIEGSLSGMTFSFRTENQEGNQALFSNNKV